MTSALKIIEDFTPVSLQEIDAVKLMDRVDTKFTFHNNKLSTILSQLKNSYRILSINDTRIHPYESVYFDTSDFKLYLQHHNGKLNRFKLRYRKYATNNKIFFEIKKKNNQGRTSKKRIQVPALDTGINQTCLDFVKKEVDSSRAFEYKLSNYFSRITFVNNLFTERITIDFNLILKNDSSTKSFENIVIAEVKHAKGCKSDFVKLMRENRIANTSISKYCLGVISLYPNVKYNAFKEKIIKLNKIKHAA
ncbi:MAG: polyphosphate polymerase domain-containing protein [Bacteroidetes bacterium]|nr:polyphosphate polymerase domain-containing protein [Bacteroidota bacterium]